jgi:hypothetical protein
MINNFTGPSEYDLIPFAYSWIKLHERRMNVNSSKRHPAYINTK